METELRFSHPSPEGESALFVQQSEMTLENHKKSRLWETLSAAVSQLASYGKFL